MAVGIPGLVVLVLMLAPAVVIYKKCKERSKIRSIFKDDLTINGTHWEAVGRLKPEPDEWEVPIDSIVVEEQLGEGAFGLVHKGYARGPLPNSRVLKNSTSVPVAIKYLKCKSSYYIAA